jgi:hypothetical protein
MPSRRKKLILGTFTHRRTESDYMGALLEAVTLEDWRDVVNQAVQDAKAGDKTARDWLARYLVGAPKGNAPTPMNVLVQQISGTDPLAERLAKPYIDRVQYPSLHTDDGWKDAMRTAIQKELRDLETKRRMCETGGKPIAARDGGGL